MIDFLIKGALVDVLGAVFILLVIYELVVYS